MNGTSLIELENKRLEKLKEFKLDDKSISEFQKQIKKVSLEESKKLGSELYKLLAKKKYTGSLIEVQEQALDLVLNGADVNYKDEKKGNFPLLVCARKENDTFAYILLRAGADPNLKNDFGTTTIMAAARHGLKDLLQVLIFLGGDVNVRYADGDSALNSAKLHDQQECFDILVKAQAHLTHRNMANNTILDIKGKVDLDLSYLENSDMYTSVEQKTNEDAMNLVNEARQKMKSLKMKF